MLELLDPLKIDPFAYGTRTDPISRLVGRLFRSPRDEAKGELGRIRRYSLLEDRRIGWNYCMDYSWLAMKADVLSGKVLDIGCGPGAIHGYLEEKFGIDIVGIDMMRWEKDYVDHVGDFNDVGFREEHGFLPDSYDYIISTSAFEHNDPESHAALVRNCLEVLKPGGRLLATLATSDRPGFCKAGNQWNLSRDDLETIYGCSFESFDYEAVRRRWNEHPEIRVAYDDWKDRVRKYKGIDPRTLGDGIPFLSVGADLAKPGRRRGPKVPERAALR